MLKGKPTQLWIAAVTATVNFAYLAAAVAGYPAPTELVAGTNIVATAWITLLAFQPPVVSDGSQVTVQTPAGQPNQLVTVSTTPDGTLIGTPE